MEGPKGSINQREKKNQRSLSSSKLKSTLNASHLQDREKRDLHHACKKQKEEGGDEGRQKGREGFFRGR